jgi:F0F1-type ATP synthase membrane subunit c/vacuolar-type H+-ATPase subunit K
VTEADYALQALSPALLSYTLAAAMLGAVTVRGTARESRRSIALMLLVFAALVEAYWAYTVPIRIPSRQKQQNGSRDETIMVCTIITHSSPNTHTHTPSRNHSGTTHSGLSDTPSS